MIIVENMIGDKDVRLSTGDIIISYGKVKRSTRIWMIRGFYHGDQNQENLVELECLNFEAGEDRDGNKHHTTWVPLELIYELDVFTRHPENKELVF